MSCSSGTSEIPILPPTSLVLLMLLLFGQIESKKHVPPLPKMSLVGSLGWLVVVFNPERVSIFEPLSGLLAFRSRHAFTSSYIHRYLPYELSAQRTQRSYCDVIHC